MSSSFRNWEWLLHSRNRPVLSPCPSSPPQYRSPSSVTDNCVFSMKEACARLTLQRDCFERLAEVCGIAHYQADFGTRSPASSPQSRVCLAKALAGGTFSRLCNASSEPCKRPPTEVVSRNPQSSYGCFGPITSQHTPRMLRVTHRAKSRFVGAAGFDWPDLENGLRQSF